MRARHGGVPASSIITFIESPLPASKLSKDILGVFSARAVWTVLGTIIGVILARHLGPYDRGVFALFVLIPATVVTFVKLGITQANVYFINREKVDATKVAANSAILALTLGISAASLVWLGGDQLRATILKGVEPWVLAIALARVPLVLLDDYLYGVLQAGGHFRLYNTRLLVSESLRLTCLATAFYVYHQGLFAAVVIHSAVNVFNIIWLVVAVQQVVPFRLRLDLGLLKKQLGFGLRSYVQTLTGHMLLRSDIYLVNLYLSVSEVAFYSLALRFTEMVLEIPQAVGIVLYPKLASLPEDEVHRLTAQACRRTIFLTGCCSVFIVLFGPYVIRWWYGEAYAAAGTPLLWASIGAMAMSIFVILTRAFTSQNRQVVNIAAGIPALVLNIALNLLMIPKWGIIGAAMSTAIAYSIACVILITLFVPRAGIPLHLVLIPQVADLRFFTGMIGKGSHALRARIGWRRR